MAEAIKTKSAPKAVKTTNTDPRSAKLAVIATGGKQYIVKEGQEIEVEHLDAEKVINFEPLLIIDGANTKIGQPTIADVKVSAEIIEKDVRADKVVAIRFKAKKRVHKRRGHRQLLSRLKIPKIS